MKSIRSFAHTVADEVRGLRPRPVLGILGAVCLGLSVAQFSTDPMDYHPDPVLQGLVSLALGTVAVLAAIFGRER